MSTALEGRVRVLGIESSCDETAAAVVERTFAGPEETPRDLRGEVLVDVVASQFEEHAAYGGVVPEIASRAHLRNVVPMVERALAAVGGMEAIDAIAVARGPGLAGALLVGLQLAKALAFATGKPIVGVDHLHGHLLAPWLRYPGTNEPATDEPSPPPAYPHVALLVSGGHTAIYRVDSPSERTLLGRTRDDAAGEAFDKGAKLLGLGYPGGPVIDRLAAEGAVDPRRFPRTLFGRESLELSFSGLKTALSRQLQREGMPAPEELADLCASYQWAIIDPLARKLVRAGTQEGVDDLVLGGGVAANRGLRARVQELATSAGMRLTVPPLRACTDNAAMIALAGSVRLEAGARDDPRTLTSYTRDPDRQRGRFRRDGTLIR